MYALKVLVVVMLGLVSAACAGGPTAKLSIDLGPGGEREVKFTNHTVIEPDGYRFRWLTDTTTSDTVRAKGKGAGAILMGRILSSGPRLDCRNFGGYERAEIEEEEGFNIKKSERREGRRGHRRGKAKFLSEVKTRCETDIGDDDLEEEVRFREIPEYREQLPDDEYLGY